MLACRPSGGSSGKSRTAAALKWTAIALGSVAAVALAAGGRLDCLQFLACVAACANETSSVAADVEMHACC